MTNVINRTIEDRLDEIEHGVHEIKTMLLKLTVSGAVVSERLMDEFMNVKELAAFAKVEPSRIYAACASQELKFIKLGKLYKFRKADAIAWLEANLNTADVCIDEYVERYLQKHIIKG